MKLSEFKKKVSDAPDEKIRELLHKGKGEIPAVAWEMIVREAEKRGLKAPLTEKIEPQLQGSSQSVVEKRYEGSGDERLIVRPGHKPRSESEFMEYNPEPSITRDISSGDEDAYREQEPIVVGAAAKEAQPSDKEGRKVFRSVGPSQEPSPSGMHNTQQVSSATGVGRGRATSASRSLPMRVEPYGRALEEEVLRALVFLAKGLFKLVRGGQVRPVRPVERFLVLAAIGGLAAAALKGVFSDSK